MGRYVEAANRVLKRLAPTIDGHVVAEVLHETEHCVIFRDQQGRLWRHLPAWRGTWPVVIAGKRTSDERTMRMRD